MINILRKIKWFIKQEWKAYTMMFVLLMLIAALSLAPAYILGLAIDVIVSGSLDWTMLFILAGGLIIVPLLRYLSSMIYNYNVSKTAQKLAFQLRQKYLSHLFEMDAEFYEKYQKGDLISRVTSDLESITIAATSMLEGIFNNSHGNYNFLATYNHFGNYHANWINDSKLYSNEKTSICQKA